VPSIWLTYTGVADKVETAADSGRNVLAQLNEVGNWCFSGPLNNPEAAEKLKRPGTKLARFLTSSDGGGHSQIFFLHG
jgi:hypothetical protein